MRICHATNFWPNRFGHAHYTDALIQGIRAHRPEPHLIAAEGDSDYLDTEAYRSIPCWRRGEDFVDRLSAAIRTMKADLVVVQYSEDLFGNDDRLPRLLRKLADAGVFTTVVYHSTYPPEWKSGCKPGETVGDFDRAVAAAASAMIVHSSRMRQDLVGRGVDPDGIVVIPHGSKAMPERDPRESRIALGLPPDAPVVLFFGYIWLGKGLDFLLEVFGRVAKRVPDAWLFVGGHTRHERILSRAYMAWLHGRTRQLGIHERTKMWGSYVPDDQVPTIYSAADVVALPYRQNYSSSSGVVHQTAGTGKLMLCSRIAKFDEVGQFISPDLLVDPWDAQEWADALARMLRDEDHAAGLRAKIRAFGEATSWPAVAKLHLAVHDALEAGEAPASAQDPALVAPPPAVDYAPKRLFSIISRMR